MLLRAGAKHLRVGRYEAQVPLKQANQLSTQRLHGVGGAHTAEERGLSTCWFVLSAFLCVSVHPSVCVLHLSTCLFQCSLQLCPSVCVFFCLNVSVCLSIFLGMPVHLCVCDVRGAILCVLFRRQ